MEQETSFLAPENIVENTCTGSGPSTSKYSDSRYRQYLIAICVNLGHILVGFIVCWPAPMVPKLQRLESNPLSYNVSDREASWIAGALTFGTVTGAQLSGYMSNLFGRKNTLILVGIFGLVGNIILLNADTVELIYLGRIVCGFGMGGTSVVNMVYIGEIASAEIRGSILTSTGASHTCGSLLVYAVAPFVSYSAVGYIGIAISTLYVVGGFFILESPVYCVIRGKNDAARTILHKLGRSKEVDNELRTLIQNAKEQKMEAMLNKGNKFNWLKIFSLKRDRKAFLITTTAFMVQQMGGAICVMYFSTSIFQKAASSVQPDMATIILGVTQVFGVILTPYFVETFGRKTLLLISSAFCGLCTALLGAHFYLEFIKHPLLDSIRWLPLVLLMTFLFFFNAGLGIIPNVLSGEMFSSNIRSTGSSITMSLGWISGFISAVTFGYITAYGSHVAFAIFTFVNFFGFFFTAAFVRETKGKSLVEIEEMMEK